MTRDEQRQAWRTYAAALLAGDDVDLQAVVKAADWMVQEERKRFGMVEPRPWKCLGQDEREKLMLWMLHNEIGKDEMWDIAERWLREKNGGTQ